MLLGVTQSEPTVKSLFSQSLTDLKQHDTSVIIAKHRIRSTEFYLLLFPLPLLLLGSFQMKDFLIFSVSKFHWWTIQYFRSSVNVRSCIVFYLLSFHTVDR